MITAGMWAIYAVFCGMAAAAAWCFTHEEEEEE